MKSTTDLARMMTWLAFGLVLYGCAALAGVNNPAIQTVLYKLGHVTTLSWVGYWVARHALGRISLYATDSDRLSRSILMGSIVIAGSMGI